MSVDIQVVIGLLGLVTAIGVGIIVRHVRRGRCFVEVSEETS
jgi:hypothetical protein